ncbi:DnaJ domain-containing protein [Nannocystis sp. RBIL2]|uniref:DnaJ C-terminal domain-containing protein n=1 Tax=Nannocystis sp. RBIL2 TaxID=2996788 RepID=UPI00226E0306|nr:DnaJ domain-containing protein [Nannocystis sp. RBIL2]
MRDLYVVLGIERNADSRAIKRAYRELTRRFHPDVRRGHAGSEEVYREIVDAYTILGDDRTRALYDEFGELSLTRGFDPARARAARERAGASDQAWQGSPWGAARPGAAADDDPDDLPDDAGDLDFDDLKHARRTVFDDLLGSFWRGREVRLDDDDDDDDTDDVDDASGGMGRDARAEASVPLARAVVGCQVQVRVGGRIVDVAVPAGARDGDLVHLPGHGEAGSPPGDLHVTIRVLPDPDLTRRGLDLTLAVPVTLLELYRGDPVEVVTPRGAVRVQIPAGCAPEHKLRLRRQGVHGPGGEVGDLYLAFRVQLPPAGDAELLRALERLQAAARPRG